MRIKQYDIWLISFDPSIGQEIQKTRPALVLSNSYYNMASGTVFVVPLTSQKPKETNRPFFVEISNTKENDLEKTSYANVSQFRAVSKLRFVQKVGTYESEVLEEVAKKFLSILQIDILELKYFS